MTQPVETYQCGVGDQGYVFNAKALEAFLSSPGGNIMQAATTQVIQDSGKGKDYFAFEVERSFQGSVRPPHWQGIGDCVSHGITGAAEDLQWVQKLLNPDYEFRWLASEAIYGLARIQIGRGACGIFDGAVVAWGIEAAQKFGFLPRGVYPEADLTMYSASLAKQWGRPRYGTPDSLAQKSTEHPLKEAHLLESSNSGPRLAEQARDVLASGGVLVSGSNQLFQNARDKQGFCGRGGRGGHCIYFRGFTDNTGRPGLAYQQSWGPGVPTQGEQTITLASGLVITLPPGCFLIDYDEFDRMHSGGDSELWAVTSEIGFLPTNQSIAA